MKNIKTSSIVLATSEMRNLLAEKLQLKMVNFKEMALNLYC